MSGSLASPTEAPHGHTLSYPLADGRAPGLTPHIDERGTTKTGEWGTTKTGERTTMLVISTMSFLLTRGLLWCGDGLVSIPYPRCAESLFFGGGVAQVAPATHLPVASLRRLPDRGMAPVRIRV